MYYVMIVLAWVMRLIMLFPLLTLIIKATITENKGKFPLPLKIISIQVALALLLQLGLTIFFFSQTNNKFLIHIFIVEEFILDMLFYRELLKKTHAYKDKPVKRNIFLVAIVLFVVFAIVNALFISDITKFPMYLFIVQCIVMIIITIRYDYVRSFQEPIPVSTVEEPIFTLYKGPVFWMNKGKQLYFSSALLICIIYNMLFESGLREMALTTWRIQDIFLIILHTFIGIGFLKYTSNPNKVFDTSGKIRKIDEENIKKRMQQDPKFAKQVREDPYYEQFRKNNPELFT